MMARTNTGDIAYDLSIFEAAMPARRERETELPDVLEREQRKDHRRRAAARRKLAAASRLRFAGVLILLLTLAVIMTFTRVILSETVSEMSDLERQLQESVNEGERLQNAIVRKSAAFDIEGYAENNLGLSKIKEYQKKYINGSAGDKVETYEQIEEEESLLEKIFPSFLK
jgi:hypothetical protein